MTDPIIRTAFHKDILKSAHQDVDTIVVDELGLKNGQVRADIAVLNGKLVGYEIKGERDSLVRLLPQVDAYSEVFEKAYIITAEKHLDKVMKYIPEWWGIYVIKLNSDNKILFQYERKAMLNESRDVYRIAQLLWKSEAAEILSHHFGYKIKSVYTRQQLYSLLAEACNPNLMSELVLKYLKNREGWRIGQPQL
ncbi:sce7726 family protein [Flavobacterium zepuense]|uniref:Sce7726 family protein n=1 Tax=Flavobacterium zepuense TaxID=2593302 RepID=A0A552V658_9FLAO|nr:sce7726 family protein [Flavobacterium zepuense]TRW25960.1 sce7726 family protein [Flavobacterium zepuense]